MYWTAQGEPGMQTFAVLVHGTGPLYSVPDPAKLGYILFDIELQGGGSTSVQTDTSIPDWIKNNAGWWSSGLIDDSSFVSGIQWLISNGIITLESEANNQEDEEGRIAGGVLTGQNCNTEIDKDGDKELVRLNETI